jgi:hypothetical protein
MPPKGRLDESQVAALREWIEAGAHWPAAQAQAKPAASSWAFQPVRATPPPATRDQRRARTPIDRFVLAKLEENGMRPSPEADRRTLIRRLTFDLTGLPPTPEEVAAFVNDPAADAYDKVVERLLASPHYGERWARHWLDLARYSDGKQAAREDTPYPNAFRYRDWVVEALNSDLPYDRFVRAQIAADLVPPPERDRMLPALGFQALGESDDDRLDVTTRVFLGLTVGCARCHDHKYDPIPARDYYSLLGVFKSSKVDEHPLVDKPAVDAYTSAKAAHAEKQAEIARFLEKQVGVVTDILASQTRDYVMAAWGKPADPSLDPGTIERWRKYLGTKVRDHKFLDAWDKLPANATEAQVREVAESLHRSAQAVLAEKKAIDDRNYVKVGGIDGLKDTAKVIKTLVEALPVEKYYFWRDLASGPYKVEDIRFPGGVYNWTGKDLERFVSPHWKRYLETLRAEAKSLEKAIPKPYPFWHVLADQPKPRNVRVAIRGDSQNLGEEAPRRFLSALCEGEPTPLQSGSGRLDLANAIASASNPLTARVMVNRVWKHHFGEGLVASTSNFGRNGDRPTHPELLDHLAAGLVASGWSTKQLHREMVRSAAYRMRSDEAPAEFAAKDPQNRLLWRANARERLEAEAMRDSVLAVAGTLDRTAGGEPTLLSDDHVRRTLYVTVSRGIPNRTMALFDFPDANSSSEQRAVTVGPMQRLFFLNSGFIARQSKALAERLERDAGADGAARIERAYQLLYARPASAEERRLGLEFVKSGTWPQYAQVLLGAAEFSSIK